MGRINSMADNTSNSSGIGFVGLLTVAFIVLKLCGIISWSWWWVLSPLWISATVVFSVIIIAAIIAELFIFWRK